MTSTQTSQTLPTRAGAREWWALAVLMLPVLLVSIDNTVLSFALPQIALHLSPTSEEQLWIIDAYSLVLAGLLVTMGTMGDRFGRKRLLLIGASGFALVSAVAAFAPTASLLIAARAAMGFFGAMLMPSTLSLLRSIFTDRDQRRLAIAIWAAGFSAGAALGPIVGGALLEHFHWGSVFLMAVPILLPMLVLVPILVPESKDPRPGKLDPLSVLLSLGAMTPIVAGIKSFAVDGFSGPGMWFVLAGFVIGGLFVRRQLRLETPMLDMSLFRRGDFSGAIIVNLMSVIGLVGFIYFVSQHLQLVLGLSPMIAGVALLPGLAATILFGLLAVPLARAFVPRVLIPAGLAFSFAAYLIVWFMREDPNVWVVVVAFASLGIGIGIAETISNELILTAAPVHKAGAASAVSETAYELGAVLGTTLLGGVLTAIYRATIEIPQGIPAAAADAARETLAGAIVSAEQLSPSLAQALTDAAAHAFDQGAGVAALMGAALIAIAAVVAATTLGGKHTQRGA